MSGFVSIAGLAIGALLLGLAYTLYGRNEYIAALIWGSVGYVVFGVGLFGGYWYYVVKPYRQDIRSHRDAAEAEQPPIQQTKRPVLAVEGVDLKRLPDGRAYVDITVRNSGDALAKNATVHVSIGGIPTTEENAGNCPEPEKAPLETMQSVGVFGINERRSAGTGIILSAKDIANVAQQRTRLYVHLLSNYDGERDKYVLEFYARYDPVTGRFNECPTHNSSIVVSAPTVAPSIDIKVIRASEKPAQTRSGPPDYGNPDDWLKWTEYTEDYFGGAIWQWGYRPEMGDKEPRNIKGTCPDCGRLLSCESMRHKRYSDGLFKVNFYCSAHHRIKWFSFRIATRDPLDAIRIPIREKLESGEWKDVVKRQINVRDGRI